MRWGISVPLVPFFLINLPMALTRNEGMEAAARAAQIARMGRELPRMEARVNVFDRGRSLIASALACVACVAFAAAPDATPVLQPFGGSGNAPAAPWKMVGLPAQTKPFTRFSVVDLDGHTALRVEADASYGNLVHPLDLADLAAAPRSLRWAWRVDQPIDAADLRRREGDDTAIKVCTLWDLPMSKVPFVERQLLRMARVRGGEQYPAATVCYVWDTQLPAGTQVTSAFTGRLKYIVLRSGADGLHRWQEERRDIAADFKAVFGDESDTLPPLAGVAVGADADNTHSHSLAEVADLRLEP